MLEQYSFQNIEDNIYREEEEGFWGYCQMNIDLNYNVFGWAIFHNETLKFKWSYVYVILSLLIYIRVMLQ